MKAEAAELARDSASQLGQGGEPRLPSEVCETARAPGRFEPFGNSRSSEDAWLVVGYYF